jgi:WD repeat-containing protein 35
LRLIDRGIAAPANLVTNQSLETHKGHVISAVWNEQHRKLTTADTAGTIVVWVLHNGIWYEEMVSNRNKCPVSCVSWGSDGKKICILYEDGTTIVGTVDGARLWAKDLRTKMRLCQWSPDAKTIMLATDSGEILFYDLFGNYLVTIRH